MKQCMDAIKLLTLQRWFCKYAVKTVDILISFLVESFCLRILSVRVCDSMFYVITISDSVSE